jgi:MoaA/NifB/PqqE/SkfB family radical SAM enzyme
VTVRQIRVPRHDTADRPFIVIWEATQACPLACRHCRAEARPDRDPGELSTAEACDLMEQVASFGSPPPMFVITGGDPFQRPDLFDLVRHGARIGLPVAVSPSGTPTLTEAGLTGLRDAGARAISLSLDGSDARIHDDFRATPGVYGWTLDAWRAARDLGLKVQINTTVTGHNLTDLPEIVRIVHEMGALTWSAFLLVPTGRGRLLPGLDAHQVEDVLNFVYDAGAHVEMAAAHHGEGVRVVEVRRSGQLGHRDLAGVGQIGVDLVADRGGTHVEHAVLGVQHDARAVREVVGDLGGTAVAEVDVGAGRDVAGDDRGELFGAEGHVSALLGRCTAVPRP